MVKIYLENKPSFFLIERKEALPALESQVLEIFEEIKPTEATVLGLFVEDFYEIKIYSFSKFVWRVVIINLRNKKKRQLYLSTQKILEMIHRIYNYEPLF